MITKLKKKVKKTVILEENDISSFDVDGTLVIWPEDDHTPGPGRIQFQYGDETVYLYPHRKCITFLKYCSDRGDFVEVWSKNKYKWANHVCEILQLKPYVDLVRSKSARHIDDKTNLNDIVGEYIFWPYEGPK
jgi:hypothetical protein